MSTPAPSLSVTATADQASYAPGATITIDASALSSLAVAATVSATLADVTVNTAVDFSIEQAASGASFGISDTTNGLLSWSQQAGTEPGTIVFTATAPAA